MPILTLLIILAVPVLAALVWGFVRARSRDTFAELFRIRKMTARITSMAELVDGGNHIPVALTLDRSQIFYESSHLQARLDIARLDEVEYDSEQGTGKSLLRLRSHGRSIEFVLDSFAAAQWAALLPSHRFGEPGLVAAV